MRRAPRCSRALGSRNRRAHPPRERHVVPARSARGLARGRSRTWVWTIILAFSIVNALGASFYVLGPVVSRSDLGGAGAWAAILAGYGIGQVAGAVTALHLRPRRPLLVGVLVALLGAAPTLLLALPASTGAIAVAAVLGGGGGMLFNTLWETTLQRNVPIEALSRVSAYDWFGSLTLAPIGFAIVGPVSDAIGVSTTLWATAAIDIACVSALLLVRDVRRIGPVSELGATSS